MGGSGCGKSTIIKNIVGICAACEVEETVGELKENAGGSKVGYAPQEDILHPELTVGESLLFSMCMHSTENASSAKCAEICDTCLHNLELVDKKHQLVSSLSGGQKKRVSIGVELVTNPKFLLLDEPTSGLDSRTTDIVIQALKEKSDAGMVVLVVIHQPSKETFEMFDRVIFLQGLKTKLGKHLGFSVLYDGNPEQAKTEILKLRLSRPPPPLPRGEGSGEEEKEDEGGDDQPSGDDDGEREGLLNRHNPADTCIAVCLDPSMENTNKADSVAASATKEVDTKKWCGWSCPGITMTQGGLNDATLLIYLLILFVGCVFLIPMEKNLRIGFLFFLVPVILASCGLLIPRERAAKAEEAAAAAADAAAADAAAAAAAADADAPAPTPREPLRVSIDKEQAKAFLVSLYLTYASAVCVGHFLGLDRTRLYPPSGVIGLAKITALALGLTSTVNAVGCFKNKHSQGDKNAVLQLFHKREKHTVFQHKPGQKGCRQAALFGYFCGSMLASLYSIVVQTCIYWIAMNLYTVPLGAWSTNRFAIYLFTVWAASGIGVLLSVVANEHCHIVGVFMVLISSLFDGMSITTASSFSFIRWFIQLMYVDEVGAWQPYWTEYTKAVQSLTWQKAGSIDCTVNQMLVYLLLIGAVARLTAFVFLESGSLSFGVVSEGNKICNSKGLGALSACCDSRKAKEEAEAAAAKKAQEAEEKKKAEALQAEAECERPCVSRDSCCDACRVFWRSLKWTLWREMKHTYGVTINPSNFPVKSSGSLLAWMRALLRRKVSGQPSSNNEVLGPRVKAVEMTTSVDPGSSIPNPAYLDTRQCRAASGAAPMRAPEFAQTLTKTGKNTTASL
jgi:ABC-type multidrug transport system ATPase subunit/nucleoid-associated protein YgaU